MGHVGQSRDAAEAPLPVPAGGALPHFAAGTARLRLASEDGRTRLADLYHAQPLRLLFPRSEKGDIFQAAIACVAGGMVAGDRHEIEVVLEAGAKAMVVGQAAEKIYRSQGADCAVDTSLTVGSGAWLEWLPQETILFDRARLRRDNRVRIDGGRLLAGDILVFGRAARGENLNAGLAHDGWDIRDGSGKRLWKDVLHMEGDLASTLAHPATFDGARAYGSAIYVDREAARYLPLAQEIASRRESAALRIGATSFNGLLLTRFLGRNALELRDAFAEFWCALRGAAAGLPFAMPRLWNV
jgi:urease accessory protein